MPEWEKTLERKLGKKFLSPNAVRDGFIESYCIILKKFQQHEGTFRSDQEINDNTFSLVREIYREKDIHYEIPPKSTIVKVDGWIREKLNTGLIKEKMPEAFREHEKTCQDLLNRMESES